MKVQKKSHTIQYNQKQIVVLFSNFTDSLVINNIISNSKIRWDHWQNNFRQFIIINDWLANPILLINSCGGNFRVKWDSTNKLMKTRSTGAEGLNDSHRLGSECCKTFIGRRFFLFENFSKSMAYWLGHTHCTGMLLFSKTHVQICEFLLTRSSVNPFFISLGLCLIN